MQFLSHRNGLIICMASVVFLFGCASLWDINEDVPPPPPIREVRVLNIPSGLSATRPAANPDTAAIAATQKAVATTPNLVPVATANVAPPSRATPIPVDPVKPAESIPLDDKATTSVVPVSNEPLLFAPYFPTEVETKLPAKWETNPVYGFPWVQGAEPSRINEEIVMGSGDQMIARLFAQVSYQKNIPLTNVKAQVKPPAVTFKFEEPLVKEESLISAIKRKMTSAPKKAAPKQAVPKQTEPIVKTEPPQELQQFVICDGATCLDAARDALVADAKAKNWEMLMNRRVSLHQSFQFRKNDRIVLIEVSSDGKKKLDIEYGLLPAQSASN